VGKKDSRRAASFWREEKREGERERKREEGRERERPRASEGEEERVPGLLEPEERIKEKREKCV